jgi:hypothetical protein
VVDELGEDGGGENLLRIGTSGLGTQVLRHMERVGHIIGIGLGTGVVSGIIVGMIKLGYTKGSLVRDFLYSKQVNLQHFSTLVATPLLAVKTIPSLRNLILIS